MKRFAIPILLMTTLTGCSSTGIDGRGRVVVHNFGYTRITKPTAPPKPDEMSAMGFKLIGFSVGDGFTVGYKADEFIQIPTDCRLFVVVQNDAQLNHLIKEMKQLEGNELCATVSPD